MDICSVHQLSALLSFGHCLCFLTEGRDMKCVRSPPHYVSASCRALISDSTLQPRGCGVRAGVAKTMPRTCGLSPANPELFIIHNAYLWPCILLAAAQSTAGCWRGRLCVLVGQSCSARGCAEPLELWRSRTHCFLTQYFNSALFLFEERRCSRGEILTVLLLSCLQIVCDCLPSAALSLDNGAARHET